MHTTRAFTALAGAVLVTTALTGAADSAASPAARGCAPAWKLVNTPAPPGNHTFMAGAAATSSRNAWFTGWDAGIPRPWVLHWDGRSVNAATALPQIPFTARYAFAGSFDSAADGWVVGASQNITGALTFYGARWYGGRWTITPLAVSLDPASIAAAPAARAVASLSPSDAWIVGGLGARGVQGAVIEHWDGSSWSIVPNPASGEPGTLFSISAASAADIWAAGWQQDAAGTLTPLAEHWDGTAWSIVPTPVGAAPSAFNAISADGPDDVWAVGDQTEPGTSNLATAFVEHWNGTAWSVVSGLPGLGNSTVTAVYAASPADLWAIAEAPAPHGARYPFLFEFLHWDGWSWTTVPLPGPQEYGLSNEPQSLAGTGPGDIWMAGYRVDDVTLTRSPMIAHLSCQNGRQ